MTWLAAIGGGAFVLASLAVSVRLLLLARRTRELPELLVGVNLLLTGGLGYPVAMWARVASDPALQTGLHLLHGAMSVVGHAAVVSFNWRVFRAEERWARRLALGYVALLVALFVWQTAAPGWPAYARSLAGPWRFLPYGTLFTLGWGSVESFTYHAKLRRRLSLGLADPVAADRIHLWTIANVSAFVISSTSLGLRELGIPLTPVLSAVVVGPLGLLAAVSMWLAFLPPRRYLRWVAGRTAAQT